MTYNIKTVNKAKLLRRQGHSLGEISLMFHTSKSTASLWTSKEKLTRLGQVRIKNRQDKAREKAFNTIKNQRESIRRIIIKNAELTLNKISLTSELGKLLLSFLMWAEGDKNLSSLGFANSDPTMIHTFLCLLRNSFQVDEAKLRALVHIHEYHNEEEVLNFWSKITQIPRQQFTKSYLKPHTGKRIKENYMGSMHIKYYDYKVARELSSIYNMFASKLRGVG